MFLLLSSSRPRWLELANEGWHLLRYIARVSNDLRLSDFRAILELHAPTAESLTMTIAEQLHAEGLAEGLARGEAEGLAKALRAILVARGLHVTAEAERRIQACVNPNTLQLWHTRAVTVATLEDVFADS